MHAIASFAFIALYCLLLFRWSSDLRRSVQPWLLRKIGETAGFRGASAPSILAIAVVFFATFLPIGALGLAARFHLISWHLARSMFIPSLFLPGLTWAAAERSKRERS